MKPNRYILVDKNVVPVADLEAWALWRANNDRRIARFENNETMVSTIFTGLDYQPFDGLPLVFETIIFGGPHGKQTLRYSTCDEALAGHAKAVALVTNQVHALSSPTIEGHAVDAPASGR